MSPNVANYYICVMMHDGKEIVVALNSFQFETSKSTLYIRKVAREQLHKGTVDMINSIVDPNVFDMFNCVTFSTPMKNVQDVDTVTPLKTSDEKKNCPYSPHKKFGAHVVHGFSPVNFVQMGFHTHPTN